MHWCRLCDGEMVDVIWPIAWGGGLVCWMGEEEGKRVGLLVWWGVVGCGGGYTEGVLRV